MGTFFSSVALQWFLRRILDWGGWIGGFLLFVINTYNALPPALQVAVTTIIEGRWQEITLGSIIPLGALVWSQIASFRATVKPQVVIDGQQLEMKNVPTRERTIIEEVATTALDKRKTGLNVILDQLDKLGRK
jgi:hypothetical protein